jgi:ATP-dependent exoDNAse (exonuclease V) beta subunit
MVPSGWREAVATDAARLLERYLSSEFHQAISSLPTSKEWEFDYFLPEIDGSNSGYYFTGGVDCLLDYGSSGCGIIDYKVSRINSRQAEAKAKEYSLQLVLYTMAVEAIQGKTVKDARLYFWRPNVAVTLAVNDEARAAAKMEMLRVCRYVINHDRENDYECNLGWCNRCGYQFFCLRK